MLINAQEVHRECKNRIGKAGKRKAKDKFGARRRTETLIQIGFLSKWSETNRTWVRAWDRARARARAGRGTRQAFFLSHI